MATTTEDARPKLIFSRTRLQRKTYNVIAGALLESR